MTVPQTEPQEVFLLINIFYDHTEDLPLAVSLDVFLEDIPINEVLQAHDIPEANFIHAGYDCHLFTKCLRSPVAKANLFFPSITALRLQAPIAIVSAVQFELDRKNKDINNLRQLWLTTPWQPDRQFELHNHNYKRIMSAMVLFSQVTCGFSKSFQMAYLALFAALEALFTPQKNKAKTLASRTAKFLEHLGFQEPLGHWLEEEYIQGRNKLAHGLQDVEPLKTQLSPDKEKVFGRLHEITRLCILGMMSLEDDKLASLTEQTGKHLREELDSLSPATGRFLDGQRPWCK